MPNTDTVRTGLPPMICRMIFDEICVLANGDIVCSCGDPAGLQVYGNVYRDRIDDVYNGQLYQRMRAWQLSEAPSSYCPVVGSDCGGRISRASVVDTPVDRAARMLQLEPIARCNLRCPGCPCTQMSMDDSYKADRPTLLPLDVMLDVVRQLPHLEKLLFYNFGEPFMHPDAIAFLQTVRRERPDVLLYVNTNGLLLTPRKIETIVDERLLDRCVFSIDGARQESYAQYRINGNFDHAFCALRQFLERVRRQNVPIEVFWQYILFEWNDSDEELAEARRMAADIGVQLQFIVTHTAGASKRYADGQVATVRLFTDRAEAFEGLTCDSRMKNLWRFGGVSEGRYLARLSQEGVAAAVSPGGLLSALVTIRNDSPSAWTGDVRIAPRLRTKTGRVLTDLPQVPVPASALVSGGEGEVMIAGPAPLERGIYELFLDVVEKDVCLFSDRGSPPLVVRFEVQDTASAPASLDSLLDTWYWALFGRAPDAEGKQYWKTELGRGLPLETVLTELAAGASDERNEPVTPAKVASLRRKLVAYSN